MSETKTMREKFEAGLRELINLGLDGDMHPAEMIPAFERELKWCRDRCQQKPDE